MNIKVKRSKINLIIDRINEIQGILTNDIDEKIEFINGDDLWCTCEDMKEALYNKLDEIDKIEANEIEVNFIDDEDKIKDLLLLSKDEFLNEYSYLTEDEYNNTLKMIMKRLDIDKEKN